MTNDVNPALTPSRGISLLRPLGPTPRALRAAAITMIVAALAVAVTPAVALESADDDADDARDATGGEFSLSLANWKYTPEGYAEDNGDRVDFQQDLGIGDESQVAFSLGYRPTDPTAKRWSFHINQIEVNGRQQRTGSFSFGPVVFVGTSTVVTTGSIRDIHLTMAKPLPGFGKRFNLAIGGTLKYLDGLIVVREEGGQENRQEVKTPLPMLNLGGYARISERLELVADGNWISAGDDSALEWFATASFRLSPSLRFTAGYQQKSIEFTDGDFRIDADFAGATLGGELRF